MYIKSTIKNRFKERNLLKSPLDIANVFCEKKEQNQTTTTTTPYEKKKTNKK